MIIKEHIEQYRGAIISRGKDCLYIPPTNLLRPYISHYCISFPTSQTMPDKYTVIPSANSVLVIFVKNGKINASYNGTNSKMSIVGDFANKYELLLLVKFQSGGFFSFYGFSQNKLADLSLDLSCIDKTLAIEIKDGLLKSNNTGDLIKTLDSIFINRLKNNTDFITSAINKIVIRNGNVTVGELCALFCYSEKHIRRLFLQQIGVSPKKFARIVRMNYTLQLLQNKNIPFTNIAVRTGFFDQSHFIHDFKSFCGLNPQEYIQNMSAFYNYNFEI